MKNSMLAAIGLLIASIALAAPTSPPAGATASESPAERLASLQAQKAINRLRLDIAKQEAELSEAQQKRVLSNPPPAPPAIPRASKPELPAPTLVSIASIGERVTGTVLIAGARKAVKQGDVLSGGWVVEKLDASGMTVTRGGETQTLRP